MPGKSPVPQKLILMPVFFNIYIISWAVGERAHLTSFPEKQKWNFLIVWSNIVKTQTGEVTCNRNIKANLVIT